MKTSANITLQEIKNSGADEITAQSIFGVLKEYHNPEECWKQLTENILEPAMPASLHQKLFKAVYNQDEKFSDAPPAWFPEESTINRSNIKKFMEKKNFQSYRELHHYSVTNKAAFWKDMLEELSIVFDKKPKQVLDLSEGPEKPHWLPDARLNITDSCFQSPKEAVAIVYSDEYGNLNKWTYVELEAFASQIANSLHKIGFKKGSRAAVNMPMTAEAVAIYLGIVKAGGAVVSIADSLAPEEVEKRLKIADTDLIFTQDVVVRGGKEKPLYEKLLSVEFPPAIVLKAKKKLSASLRHGDMTWQDFLVNKTSFKSASCSPQDYCNILFSSGTTGDPKAIPWTHTTPIKSATDGFFHQDIQAGDVVAWPTNIGWMMGPWLIFASLINKATIALFYGAPTGRPFGEFVRNAGVNMLGVVPSMVKRWLETGCMQGLDWSSIKLFSSTGESSNPQDYLWLMARAGYRPVIEYCGGTEIGGGYLTGTVIEPASPSAFTTPTLGLDLTLLNDEGKPDSQGELFLIPPSIGLSTSLLNKDHYETYFSGLSHPAGNWKGALGTPLKEQSGSDEHPPVLRRHGDEMRLLENGYFRAQGRADDTMNLGGIKTSSVEIERLLDMVEGIKETAAIAVDPPSGGPKELVICYVPKDGVESDSQRYMKLFQQTIRTKLNPLFKISDVVQKDSLPRTASNKVMRRVLREEYEQGDG